MVLPFRKTLFWIHLAVGVVTGIVVAVMSVTGVALAFQPQVIAWAESEARTVSAPGADARRLSVEELMAKVREARPEAQVSGITVYPSETASAQVALGRTAVLYVNPYSGEVRDSGSQGWRAFFHLMEEWHRWLATGGDNRAVGKAITGGANAGFLFLALSGLYLWWPRNWSRKAVRSVVWFRGGLKGKARDFNWHNVMGFWMMPVLVVLTASGMVISYKWASDLVYTVTGNEVPAQGGGGVKVPAPETGAERKTVSAMLSTVQEQVPTWASITYRIPAPPKGGQGKPGEQAGSRGGGESRGGAPDTQETPGPAKVDAVSFSVKEKDGWPLFAATQVSVDPFTGQVAKREGYADLNSGRQARSWLRFLHTGEALGWPGQLLAAIASLAGAFLVWTGFALSWRRFFPRRQRAEEPSHTGESETPA
ncbi:PepSY-associated TM helix domain-containing protein [Myxococcus stipitatus]|uniref:PepSY-associated TM helix domain-containing protein n=1 Tax=Myxococcus stipitatus TaxID=83455 RepID=UPI0030CC152D